MVLVSVEARWIHCDWESISNYQADFQTGTPAAGWRFAWNPKGKVGTSAAYAGLRWSEAARGLQYYRRSDAKPNPKAHPDDYLAFISHRWPSGIAQIYADGRLHDSTG